MSHRYPILIQGPTSSGKTSMIEYIAKKTGHRFVRINNHEHTDLSEYIGNYVSDESGKLVFQEVFQFGFLIAREYWFKHCAKVIGLYSMSLI
jgi:midasin (ATPase involved in ribosome maturation)